MRKFLLLLLTGLTVVLTTSASASLYVDLYSPEVIFGENGLESYTWNFDLIDDILHKGDIDDNDVIESVNLGWKVSKDLKDNKNNSTFDEYIDIYINGALLWDNWEMDNKSWVILDLVTTPPTFKVEFKDFNDGHKNKDWDIVVSDVKIFGVYTDMPDVPGNHAPEPATLILFGLGLLGLAGISRKKMHS